MASIKQSDSGTDVSGTVISNSTCSLVEVVLSAIIDGRTETDRERMAEKAVDIFCCFISCKT